VLLGYAFSERVAPVYIPSSSIPGIGGSPRPNSRTTRAVIGAAAAISAGVWGTGSPKTRAANS
jgi:hypothetical protein